MTDRPTDKFSMTLEGVQDAFDRMTIQHSPSALTLSDERGTVVLLSVFARRGERARVGLQQKYLEERPAAMLTAPELRQHIAACVAALAVMEGE